MHYLVVTNGTSNNFIPDILEHLLDDTLLADHQDQKS